MTPQTILFKRTNSNAVLPTYGTEQADCFDFYLCDDVVIRANQTVPINIGLIALIPKGHALHLFPRSGISIKQGIVLANLTGIIDADYTNELIVALKNISDTTVGLKAGTRVAQGRLVESVQHIIGEYIGDIDQIGNRTGGLGSTGQ